MKKLKVVSVVGTRPEIIRLSRVLARLDEHCDHVLVHTGQNYDYELNQVFFDDLGEDFERDVVGNMAVFDELTHKVEIGLRGRRKGDFDFLEADVA